MTDFEAVLRWTAAFSVVSFACAPLLWWLGDGLGSSVHGITRALGVVVVTALLWWPAALLNVPFTNATLLATLALVGVPGWVFWFRLGRSLRWQALIAFECLWLALFAGYLLFRAYQPDIVNTEKPMEIALLSSVSRSSDVPAPDPWFAGEAINYYYFGYQTIASLVKLSGVPTGIAFNLALATLFASVGTVAAAVGFRVARLVNLSTGLSLATAGCAAFFVLIAGNLESAWRIVRDPGDAVAARFWYEGVGWQASRVIVDHGVHGQPGPRGTINEFPAFAFVLGDLHPHVLTYPLLLGIVALIVGFICLPATISGRRMAVIGAFIGLLYVSNSWDAPTGGLFLAVALVLALGYRTRAMWTSLGIAAVAAFTAALPFLLHFTPPVGVAHTEIPELVLSIPLLGTLARTIGVVTWRPSGVGELLIVHGHWIAAFTLFALFAERRERMLNRLVRKNAVLTVLAALITLVLAILWAPGLILLGAPLAASLVIVIRSAMSPTRLVAGLFATGFFLTLVPEFVYIQDAFGDRMNTVFKLYFQAWLFLGIATASAMALGIADASRAVSRLAAGFAAVLLLVVAPYTPISARDWTDGFQTRHGLDGAAYIARHAPHDYLAIQWLIDYAPEDATLVEGPGCSYQGVQGVPTNRMSAFSGVPALVGWIGHERQWRRGEEPSVEPLLIARQEAANQWLEGVSASLPDAPEPSFVVLGAQERSGSDTCDSLVGRDTTRSRFLLEASGWTLVFEAGETWILSRPELPEESGFRD